MKAKAVHRTLGKIHLELDPHEAKFIRALFERHMDRHKKWPSSVEYRIANEFVTGIDEALAELG